MACELLRQVRVLNPLAESETVADVLIIDGQVQSMGDRLDEVPDRAEIYHQPGLILGPGLVDLYSHSGEPGFETRESLTSLSESAQAGGFTRLTVLPDTNPPIDTPASLELLYARLEKAKSLDIQIHCWGALTVRNEGQNMAELGDLATAGVVGFADSQPLQHWGLIRRLLEYAQPLAKPIALWPCSQDLVGRGVVREGAIAVGLGLPGNPDLSETVALTGLLECIARIGTPVHIMRVSTARSVELIQAAKARDLPITASTTWMHVMCTMDAIKTYDPSLKLDPPLGNPEDQAALIRGLETGILDAIAIDHSPFTYEEKMVAFAETPPGAIGLELALPLLWQQLVVAQQWSAQDLWQCLSTRPARCLGQSPPTIALHQPAELVLFDPQKVWKVMPDTLKSRSSNTPWLGREIQGQVIKTWGYR